jgi:multicomponent K+:H+ antiporter subunit D
MTDWLQHLIVMPILLPLLTAGLMLLLDERNRIVKATLNLLSTSALLAIAIGLVVTADSSDHAGGVTVYLLGNWPPPIAIVLVLDRLAALMLLVTSILALCALLFSLARWHAAGPHFHPLFQLLLMGVNGAFLTGDLFNLFVFFEVMLAASYGLALHGSGRVRVRASLHYIAFNLATAMLFLIGVSMIYGVTGTLNMAHLATRIPLVEPESRVLLEIGAAVLGIAFLVKAGMWPLSFWLPTTYAAACAPVAAMFAILSKVGIYVLLRLWLLLFGTEAGASAFLGSHWLLAGGLMTVLFGSVGALASQDLRRLAGFSILVSSGTLLSVMAIGREGVTSGALFYLVSSTLALGAFFLLIELLERDRDPGADILAVTIEAFGLSEMDEPEEEQEVGVVIPATMALLGVSFVACALIIAGLPPLSGFIAKFAILTAMFNLGDAARVPLEVWLLLIMIVGSGIAALIAVTRAGIRTFWTPFELTVPRIGVIEMLPVAMLLLACLAMTIQAGPIMRYMRATATTLHAPHGYVNDVLTASPLEAGSAIGQGRTAP